MNEVMRLIYWLTGLKGGNPGGGIENGGIMGGNPIGGGIAAMAGAMPGTGGMATCGGIGGGIPPIIGGGNSGAAINPGELVPVLAAS